MNGWASPRAERMQGNKPKSTRGPFRFSKSIMKAFEEQTDLDVMFKCSDGEGRVRWNFNNAIYHYMCIQSL